MVGIQPHVMCVCVCGDWWDKHTRPRPQWQWHGGWWMLIIIFSAVQTIIPFCMSTQEARQKPHFISHAWCLKTKSMFVWQYIRNKHNKIIEISRRESEICTENSARRQMTSMRLRAWISLGAGRAKAAPSIKLDSHLVAAFVCVETQMHWRTFDANTH